MTNSALLMSRAAAEIFFFRMMFYKDELLMSRGPGMPSLKCVNDHIPFFYQRVLVGP